MTSQEVVFYCPPERPDNKEVRDFRQKEMPRDRIELSTPGFSDQCSTTELPRHYLYIISNLRGVSNFFPARGC